MYFTSGSDRAFEQLMQGKPGFDHYDSGEAVTPEDCGTCRFYRPHWKYQFCVYAECPYQPGKLTAYDAVTFRVKGVENMAVFRVERNKGYTVMSNHHLIIAKLQPFTPAFPWATRTGTAARATAYRTKKYFWRTMPEGST